MSLQNIKQCSKIYFEYIVKNLSANFYLKNSDGVILTCNDKLAHSTGLEKSFDVIGRSDYQLSWKVQADKIKQNDFKVLSTESILAFEETGTFPDGKIHHFLTIKGPLRNDISNVVIGILGVSIDISEHKYATHILTTAKKINNAKSTQIYLLLEEVINIVSQRRYDLIGQTKLKYLAKREFDCAQYLILGLTTKEIAKKLIAYYYEDEQRII